MDRLPQETVDKIMAHLDFEPKGNWVVKRNWLRKKIKENIFYWANVATVSGRFQAAVERQTFRSINFKSSDDFSTFNKLFSTARRRRALRDLTYHVMLPSYTLQLMENVQHETDEDRESNNRAATAAISCLLYQLADWPSDERINLHLVIESVSDPILRRIEHFEFRRASGLQEDSPHDRWCFSYLTLSKDMGDEPLVPCIRRLDCQSQRPLCRQFDPGSWQALVNKFPNSDTVRLAFAEPSVFHSFRMTMRDNLTKHLASLSFAPSTRAVEIRIEPPLYVYGELLPRVEDSLGSVLHHLIGDLTTARVRAQLDSTFFWPYPFDSSPEPFWQSMQELEVGLEITSPAGKWLFTSRFDHLQRLQREIHRNQPPPHVLERMRLLPVGHGGAENHKRAYDFYRKVRDNQWGLDAELDALLINEKVDGRTCHPDLQDFRLEVNEKLMEPVLLSMLKALAQMRSVRRLTLYAYLTKWPSSHENWTIEYYAPHKPCSYDPGMSCSEESHGVADHARFVFKTQKWRPSEGLLESCRAFGREKTGCDAILFGLEPSDVVISSLGEDRRLATG